MSTVFSKNQKFHENVAVSTYKISWYIFCLEQSLGLLYLSDEIDQVNFVRLPGLLLSLLLSNQHMFSLPNQTTEITDYFKELDEDLTDERAFSERWPSSWDWTWTGAGLVVRKLANRGLRAPSGPPRGFCP